MRYDVPDSSDRTRLTDEEAFELVKLYVDVNYPQFAESISEDKEDVVMDVALKVLKKDTNKDYDKDWKPGDTLHIKRASGKPYKDYDTSYMLADNYNPDNPYDPLYYIPHMKEVSYVDRYDGKTTSKKYYIQGIVKTTLIDMTRKKDPLKNAISMDTPLDNKDGSDSRTTVGDTIPDDNYDSPEEFAEKQLMHDIIMDILSELSTKAISDRIVGWSPITGEKDAQGNHVDNPLTVRDIGLFIMYGYEPAEVAEMYHDTRTGENVSVSTIRKKWNDALEVIRQAFLSSEQLKGTGFLKGVMKK